MIYILPIAHRVNINRLPKVTIGLIIANAIFFAFTWRPIVNETSKLQRMYEQVISHGESTITSYCYSTRSRELAEDFNSRIAALRKPRPDDVIEVMHTVIEPLPSTYNRHWMAKHRELQLLRRDAIIFKIGLTPADARPHTFLTHMFSHGGVAHLFFNMWFLYLAGFCLENYWGRFTYLGFYLIGGVAAAAMHMAIHPSSMVPLIGASGAISAVMGAFAVRFAKESVQCVVGIFLVVVPLYRRVWIPALALVAFYFGMDLLVAIKQMAMQQSGSVALWAHIGGIIFGGLFALFFKVRRIEEKYIRPELEKLPEYQHFEQHPDLEFAMGLMEKGQYNEALAYVDKFLSTNPAHWEARVMKARIFINAGRREDSKAVYMGLFEEARQRADKDLLTSLNNEFFLFMPDEPLPGPVLLAIGRACFERGDYQKADTIFERLLTEAGSPDIEARGLFYLARIKAEQQMEIKAARRLYAQFLDKYPDHAWAETARLNLAKLPPDIPGGW